MFTGIIEEIGKVKRINRGSTSATILIDASYIMEDISLGDSIAVNGICLTVTAFHSHGFSADVMPETMNRSSLDLLTSESSVNLERAMKSDGRFGGHIVSGHIDGTGTIIEIKKDENAIWYTISTNNSIMKYIIEKGSVAIDGVSLTVAKVSHDKFSVSIIPHTISKTILSEKKPGDMVNLENDLIGKYIEHFMTFEIKKDEQKKITEQFLFENGF